MIVMAEIFCPFPGNEHPQARAAVEQTYRWLEQFGFQQNGVEMQYLRRSNILHFPCCVYSQAEFDKLVLTVKLMAWIVILEIVCEAPADSPPDELSTLLTHCASLLTIEQIAPLNRETLINPPLEYALHSIWQDIFSCTPIHWRQRFCQDVNNLVSALKQERENFVQGAVPDLASYIAMREHTGFTHILLDMIDIVDQIFLPPFIYHCPDMHNLIHAAVEHVNWVNDLHSWNKETLAGDPNNIITVLQHAERYSVQEAIEWTSQRIRECVWTITKTKGRLLLRFPAHTKDLHLFVASVQRFLIGDYLWYETTDRYLVEPPAGTEEIPFYLIRPILVTGGEMIG
jgi:hypothetical protein